MKKEIDVIIPAYNAHKWIGDLLRCLEKQTAKSLFHVTIIDDGSKETYDSLLNNLNLNLDVKVIRSKRNRGLINARILGIKNTSCEYVLFLDADDLITNANLILEMYQQMKENNYNVVYAKEFNKGKHKCMYHDYHIAGKMLRRSIIKNYHIKSHKYTMEEDTSFMMSYYSVIDRNTIFKIDKLFYKYNTDNSGITSKYTKFENYDYTTLFSSIKHAYRYARKYNNFWYFKENMFKIFLFLANEYQLLGIHSTNKNTVHSFLLQSKRFYIKYNHYINNYLKFNKISQNYINKYNWFKNIIYNI